MISQQVQVMAVFGLMIATINRNNVLMNNSGFWHWIREIYGWDRWNRSGAFYFCWFLGSVYSVTSIQMAMMPSNHGIYKYVDKQLSLLPNTQGKPGILVK
jgi:homoserine trans-succinylase